MKQRQERTHFTEVKNEIIYRELIINKLTRENLILFCHSSLYNRCFLFSFGDLCQPQKLIYFCAYEILKIIKMSCNTLIF